jgi:hypothetical protein
MSIIHFQHRRIVRSYSQKCCSTLQCEKYCRISGPSWNICVVMRSFRCTLDGCGGGTMNPLYPCYHDNAYFTPTTRRKWTRPLSAAQPSIKSSISFYYSYSSEADTQTVCCRPRGYPRKPVGLECTEKQDNLWQTAKFLLSGGEVREWIRIITDSIHRISRDLMKYSANAKGKRSDKQEGCERRIQL